MIDYHDFVPKVIKPGGFLSNATYETLDDALRAANEWISKDKVDIVNIETVVLPNMHTSNAEGSNDVGLDVGGESDSTWHQFIRVWYRTEG